MIHVNEDNKVNAIDIYQYAEVKTRFDMWIKRCIEYADLEKDKDFCTVLVKSNGGRPSTHYYFTLDAAKEVCLVSETKKAKELRRWLIKLSNQKENLELITVKEAAFAVKVINCLRYIENQKEAYTLHQTKFVNENIDILNKKYIYSEFAKYRTNITGWDKSKVDAAIDIYLNQHVGYNRNKIDKKDMQTKLSIMDIGEAIRVACLDILYSKNTDENLADRFSILCKNLAKEMKIQPEKKNENNIFHEKQALANIENLKIEKL